ncbi:hypothetical protein [Sphaerisporangium dianthi]|uniref:Heavy metal translocating P-type ATPase n=1 Tax=Sphaerisporangium dianthi TaxID=1436120 RepID=A0ABV9CD99_9ACTN
MAQKTTAAPERDASEDTGPGRAAGRPGVTLPLIGRVVMPSPDRVAFYVALGLLSAFEIIEWPLALIIGFGHFLAEQHFSRALQGVGQATEAV